MNLSEAEFKLGLIAVFLVLVMISSVWAEWTNWKERRDDDAEGNGDKSR